MLAPPNEESLEILPKLVKNTFRISAERPTDIVIPGLGWISTSGKDVTVEVHAPQGIAVSLRKSLI